MNGKEKIISCDGCYKPRPPDVQRTEKAQSTKGNLIHMNSPMSTWSRRNEI